MTVLLPVTHSEYSLSELLHLSRTEKTRPNRYITYVQRRLPLLLRHIRTLNKTENTEKKNKNKIMLAILPE